uniref:Piwi domain-containing protein n=1 Tax=Leersia perrieri TaxID=77586 RepID=A0A0D9XW93_9ORYZ
MIDGLFKPQGAQEDDGLIRELLVDFYTSTGKHKPDQVIIFGDGVSESQFTQVLNIELDQIIEACKFLDENWSPKFTLIVEQKNHHTKIFVPASQNNGTTRPTHYHILHDEIGFSADDLQELLPEEHYSHINRCTHLLAAAQVSQFIKFDEMSETSSSHGGHTSAGSAPVPELPRLHNKVRSSMFSRAAASLLCMG